MVCITRYKTFICFYNSTGRWRILKTGVRLHGLEIVDDIWFTCCALHNMLLNCDGLDRSWKKGVLSPFQKELGWHAPGDTETYCDPIVFQRFRSGKQGTPARQYDNSIIGLGPENPCNVVDEEEDNEENDDGEGAKCLYTLSNNKFRNLLVIHFSKLWELGKLIWPSRTGKMVH